MSRLQWQPVQASGGLNPAATLASSMQMFNNSATAANNLRDREIQNAQLMQNTIAAGDKQIAGALGMQKNEEVMSMLNEEFQMKKDAAALQVPLTMEERQVVEGLAQQYPGGPSTMPQEVLAQFSDPRLTAGFDVAKQQQSTERTKQGEALAFQQNVFRQQHEAKIADMVANGYHQTAIDAEKQRFNEADLAMTSKIAATYSPGGVSQQANNLGYSGEGQQVLGRYAGDGSTINSGTSDPMVQQIAQRIGVDPTVMGAVSFMESGGNVNAVSPTGVQGPMQVTGAAFDEMVKENPTMFKPGATLKDTEANYTAGGLYWKKKEGEVSAKLGRQATPQETYLAYNLGLAGSGKLIQAPDNTLVTQAGVSEKSLVSNKDLYFKGGDLSKPKTKGEVMAELDRRYQTGLSKTGGIAGQAPTSNPVETELSSIAGRLSAFGGDVDPFERVTPDTYESVTTDIKGMTEQVLDANKTLDAMDVLEFGSHASRISKKHGISENAVREGAQKILDLWPNAKYADQVAILEMATTSGVPYFKGMDEVSLKKATENYRDRVNNTNKIEKNLKGMLTKFSKNEAKFNQLTEQREALQERMAVGSGNAGSTLLWAKDLLKIENQLASLGKNMSDSYANITSLYESNMEFTKKQELSFSKGSTSVVGDYVERATNGNLDPLNHYIQGGLKKPEPKNNTSVTGNSLARYQQQKQSH